MQKRKCFLATAALTALTAGSAHACYTVKFDNTSEKDVNVIWKADGCAGIEHWTGLTCAHKTVKAGSRNSYDYNWGTTEPIVIAYKNVSRGDHITNKVSYRLWEGKFIVSEKGPAESPPSCGRSYSITFTQNDWESAFGQGS
ncbi:MAG: hypothetical protein AAFX54_03155 [Pseudomonadota bacterium]